MLFESYKNAYPMLRIFPEKIETETRLVFLEDELANKNKEIAELKTNGHKKASDLSNLELAVGESNEEIEHLRQQAAKRDEYLKILTERLNHLEKEKEQKIYQLT
jgi:septal ring factor EnvC (AmiA/AmiB activator)